MPAAVGQPAPDFTLQDQQNNQVSLEDLRGQKALIVFIPFPFTGVCEGELCAIRDDLSDLEAQGAKVIAITCDTRFSNKRWADDNNFTYPILSDYWPHGTTAQAFGCFNETVGCANRWSYVLDAEGVVRTIIKSDELPKAREHVEYAKALAAV